MSGYTMVPTQSTGTASAQPIACRILSTTSGYLRAPVPEMHRSRTAKSSTSNTSLVARLLTAASQVVPSWPPLHLASVGHRRLGVVARGHHHAAERRLLPPRRTDL